VPVIQAIPIQQPIDEEDMIRRFNEGWRIAGQVLVSRGHGIVTTDNPTGVHVMPCNIWILPEPMVPLSEIFSTLFKATEQYAESGSGMMALNFVSMMLFGASVKDLLAQMKEKSGAEPREPDRPGSDTTSLVA
jgi:hypothetical protein